jgi:hypothetical protein
MRPDNSRLDLTIILTLKLFASLGFFLIAAEVAGVITGVWK